MVTGEGELYQVKDKQKRKNHRELLVEYSGRAKLTFKCREFAATPSRKR